MDTICKPSYANIFMDHIEKKYVYHFLQGIPLIYIRFIDDGFFIIQSVKLVTTIYQKNIEHLNIFPVVSEHPKSLKGSIQYSSALRINRYCEELKQRC